jgi:AcrR family transcriptional regulator
MARWEPDAPGRMTKAALDLYAEHGYEQTTVADIAERAGVTERTFFRHFADKREVLFDRSNTLQTMVIAAIAAAPAETPPVETVVAAFESATGLFDERRDYSRRRAAVIAANASLQERELLKLASLSAAAGEALRHRGVPEPQAGLAAETGVTTFRVGFERWIADEHDRSLAKHIRAALDELRKLTAY